MTRGAGVNRWLDQLPRTRFGRWSREVPAFRSCGTIGFYAALVATLAGGLLRGASLMVLAVVAASCAFSFYGWASLRRAITSREELVLIEHVWIALLAASLTLRVLGQPALYHLDIIAVGLAIFLAAGRVGCLLVGCCHGKPAAMGITYGAEHALEGFPRHLVGVRLFPVPAIEALSLALIGLSGLAALPFAPAGSVSSWFLGAYSIVRFGLEGLRGDRRPHWWGLSVGRWMAVTELVVVAVILERSRGADWWRSPAAIAVLVLGSLLLVGVVSRHRRSLARRLLRPRHLRSLRALVRERFETAEPRPKGAKTEAGVTVALSRAEEAAGCYVSLRLPDGLHDVALLAAVAARALPEIDPETARISEDGRVLLLHLAEVPAETEAQIRGARQLREPVELGLSGASMVLEDLLYTELVRQLADVASEGLQAAPTATPNPAVAPGPGRRPAAVELREDSSGSSALSLRLHESSRNVRTTGQSPASAPPVLLRVPKLRFQLPKPPRP